MLDFSAKLVRVASIICTATVPVYIYIYNRYNYNCHKHFFDSCMLLIVKSFIYNARALVDSPTRALKTKIGRKCPLVDFFLSANCINVLFAL